MRNLAVGGPLEDVAGWALFVAGFAMVLLARECRRDGRLVLMIWAAVFVRNLLAMRAAYFTGLSFDALSFYFDALRLLGQPWTLGIGEHFYPPTLAFLFDALGRSPFLGIQLSVVAFTASCLTFVKLTSLLGLERYRLGLLGVFAFTPSAILLTSTMLREAFQLSFFIVSVYWGLKYRVSRKPLYLGASGLAALVLGFLHNGLIALAPVLVAVMALWPLAGGRIRPGFISPRGIVVWLVALPLAAGAGVFVYSIRGKVHGSQALQALSSSSQLFETVKKYRAGGMEIEARATYGVQLETSSPAAFVKSSGLILAYYMFAPFPWQVSTLVDAYGAMEAAIRAVLLVSALLSLLRLRGPPRRLAALLLVMYGMTVAMWAIGTVNYGTALRHHLTTNWILLLLGGPGAWNGLMAFARRLQPLPPAHLPA